MGKKRVRTIEEMERDEKVGLQMNGSQEALLERALQRLPPHFRDQCMTPENEEMRVRCVRGMETEEDPVKAVFDAIKSVLTYRSDYNVDEILTAPLEEQGPCPKERNPLTR
jgi:hypothetical protein